MPDTTQKTLREVIAEAMADAEYQQQYPTIRAALKELGFSSATLYDYMEGQKKEPKLTTLASFARVFPKYGADFYRAAGYEVPSALADTCPPYCETANAIAARLGVSKEEAIMRAVERYAEQLTVAA